MDFTLDMHRASPLPLGRRSIGIVSPFRVAVLAAAASLTLVVPPALAGLTWTGQTVPNNPSAWTGSTTGYVGGSVDGSVAVDDGFELRANNAFVGYLAGATGTVTVDGAGSAWSVTQSTYIGYAGKGSLAITSGAAVSNSFVNTAFEGHGYIGHDSGSTGTVSVDGAGSTWTMSDRLYVGKGGSGLLAITGGGAVSNTYGTGAIGLDYGSMGVVTVDGAGSIFTVGYSIHSIGGSLQIGGQGSGTLTITDGGAASSGTAHIGYVAGSTGSVTVDGPGSTWTNGENLYVGYEGSGSLAISGGGAMSNMQDAYVGREIESIGSVTVDGLGSAWTTSDALYVGYQGKATLSITNGGAVTSSESYIGYRHGSTGAVTVSGEGSTWTDSGIFFYVGGTGRGTVSITEGGLVSVRRLLIANNLADDSYVNMSSGGMLALLGDADDSLAQFLDLVSGTDAIRYWDDGLSAWSLLTGAAYGDDYTLEYLTAGELAGYTLLTVLAPGPPGDFNLDGLVDGGDFLAWQRGDSPDPHSPADLAAWQAHYGADLSAATAAAIPEPAAWVLAALGAMLLVRRRAGRHC